MTRTLVIPMFNEAARIGDTLATIGSSPLNDDRLTIVIVDDGSHDDSVAVARAALHTNDLDGRVLAEPHRGKGGAVRAGVLAAAGDHVVFTDADLSAPVSDIVAVFDALDDGEAVVAGDRTSELGEPAPPLRQLSRRAMTQLVRRSGLTTVSDTQCGLKGFQREIGHTIVADMTTDGFAFDVELLARAEHLGHRVATVPVGWRHREGSSVRLLRDAPRMIRDVIGLAIAKRRWG